MSPSPIFRTLATWCSLRFCLALLLSAFACAAWFAPLVARPTLVIVSLVVAGYAWWRATVIARTAPPSWCVLLGGAFALRGLALAASFGASDDVFRYAWEAEVIAHGASPYAFAPSDPQLAELRGERPELYAHVAHREVAAAYPPLAQASSLLASLLARIAAGRADAIIVWRALAACWDLLVLVPLWWLARSRGLGPGVLVIWAWSPLIALEFAGSAHFDALGIALWLAALALAARDSSRASLAACACLALATLVKYLPVQSAPFVARGRRAALGWFVLALVVIAGFAPLFALRGGGAPPFAGLQRYAFWWNSTNLVFRCIEWPARVLFGGSALNPDVVARGVALAIWSAVLVKLSLARTAPIRAAFLLTGLALALGPTLHPWYLTWIVPFLAFEPSRAWSWLCATAPLLYVVIPTWQRDGVWREPLWLWPALALPFFGLLVLDRRDRLRRRAA